MTNPNSVSSQLQGATADEQPAGFFAVLAGDGPAGPNFYKLLNEQCALVTEGVGYLVEYMDGNDPQQGEKVAEIEHRGDDIKARNLRMLNSRFTTSLDREDIWRAISTLDMILNYAKTTVREMQILGVQPDKYTLEMAVLLRSGVESLQSGYEVLNQDPRQSQGFAQAAIKAERNIDKVYRRAVGSLFEAESNLKVVQSSGAAGMSQAIQRIMVLFKQREIYQHLSNAGDHLARAGEVLHDIVVQIS